MKHIHIQIEDDIYTRLKALCTHPGQYSHIIRAAIKQAVVQLEKIQKDNENA